MLRLNLFKCLYHQRSVAGLGSMAPTVAGKLNHVEIDGGQFELHLEVICKELDWATFFSLVADIWLRRYPVLRKKRDAFHTFS